MKKKILLFAFALFLIVPCTFLLGACDFGSSSSKTSKPSENKTNTNSVSVQNVNVTITNDAYSETNESFSFTYGEAIGVSKNDFSLTVEYSDGKTKQISADKFEYFSNLPSQNEIVPGSYSVEISYKEGNYTFSKPYTIYVESIVLSFIDFTDKVEFTYTGSEINPIKTIDNLLKQNNKETVSSLISSNKVTVDNKQSTASATDVGDYYIVLTPNNGYSFDNGSQEYAINWKINKKTISYPTVSTTSFVFDGTEKHLQLNWENAIHEALFTVSGTTATHVGSYTCNVTLKSANEKNYQLDNSTTGTIYWDITPKYLDKPVLKNYDTKNDDFYTYVYTGEVITPEVEMSSEVEALFDVQISDNAINANSENGRVDFTLKQNAYASDYRWNSVSFDTLQDFTLYFGITQAEFDFPEEVIGHLDAVDYYRKGMNVFSIALPSSAMELYSNFTEETIALLSQYGLLDGDYSFQFNYEENSDQEIVPGSYTVKCLYYKDTTNFKPCNIDINLTILNCPVQIRPSWSNYYSSFDLTYYKDSDYSCELTDLDVWTIYGNAEDAHARSTGSKIFYKENENDFYVEVSEIKNAGYYKVIAYLACDEYYYMYLYGDENNTPITEVNTTFRIKKQQFNMDPDGLHWSWSGTYDTIYTEVTDEQTGLTSPKLKTIEFSTYNPVDISYAHYYKTNKNDVYTAITKDELTAVGYYKTIVTIDYDHVNYELVGDTTYTKEWRIYPKVIDLSEVSWPVETIYAYTGDYANIKLLNLPACVTYSMEYYSTDPNDYGKVNVGDYYAYISSFSIKDVEGSEGATIINDEHIRGQYVYNESTQQYDLLNVYYFSITPIEFTSNMLNWCFHDIDSETYTYTDYPSFSVANWEVTLGNWYLNQENIVYENNHLTEPGTYTVTATITADSLIGDNYYLTQESITVSIDVEIYEIQQ